MASLPCSSEARSYVAAGSSQTSGGPESKASAFNPASTMAPSSAGRLITHRPHEKARLEDLGRGTVAVEIAAIVGVYEDVGAALQFGVDAARRFELEGAGAGDGRAFDAVARQQVGSSRPSRSPGRSPGGAPPCWPTAMPALRTPSIATAR
jgi:hypothetical protein